MSARATPRKPFNRTAVVVAMAAALLVGSAGLRPAKAVYIPPCEAWECPAGGATWWGLHGTIVLAGLALFEYAFSLVIDQVTDTVSRLSNADSQDSTYENISGLGSVEQQNINAAASRLGEVRSKNSLTFVPSASGCALVSNRLAVLNASEDVRAQVRQSERKYSALFSNETSTPAAAGTIGYLGDRFNTRMTRYCSNANTGATAVGVNCAASMGADADLKPYEAIFKKTKFADNTATSNENITAQDVVLNLLGNNISDPVRNQALERPEGRNMSLIRYGQQAQLNLASSALMQMVERRRSGWVDATQKASFADASMDKLAIASAKGAEAENMRNVTELIGESNKQLMTFYTFMEQWAALKAVSLSIDVQENSAKGASASSSGVSN